MNRIVIQEKRENCLVRFARCFLPIITFGDVIQDATDDDTTPGHHTYNGFISSMVVFITTTSFAFMNSLSLPIGAKLDNVMSSCVTLITLMSVSVGAMIYLGVFHSKRTPIRREQLTQLNTGGLGHLASRLLRDNLSLIGITIFFCLSCVPEIFHIISPANCADVWTLCVASVRNQIYILMVFHAVRMLYIGAELMFCFQFHRMRFRDRWPIRCGLMIIQSANLSLWFDAVIWEGMHANGGYNNNITETCGYEFSNLTIKITKCLAADTYEYGVLNNQIAPYFYPFIIEFTLLAADCFGHLFFQCRPDSTSRSNSGHSNVDDFLVNAIEETEEEKMSLLPTIDGSSTPRKALITKIALLVGVVINVTFCILAFLSQWEYQTSSQSSQRPFLQMYIQFYILHKSSQVICIIAGYIFARDMKPVNTPFAGLDYLVILSAGGTLLSRFFSIMAIEGLNEMSITNGTSFYQDHGVSFEVFFSTQFVSIIEVFLQVTFVFFAERVITSIAAGPNSFAVSLFKAILLYLALCNCSHWLIDSFVVRSYSMEPIYFTKYYLVGHVLTTLKLFFRFSSFLFFVRAFLNN